MEIFAHERRRSGLNIILAGRHCYLIKLKKRRSVEREWHYLQCKSKSQDEIRELNLSFRSEFHTCHQNLLKNCLVNKAQLKIRDQAKLLAASLRNISVKNDKSRR